MGPDPRHKGSDEAEGLPCLWDFELTPRFSGGISKLPWLLCFRAFPNSSVVYDAHLGFWEYPVVLPVLFPSVS